MFKNLKLWKTQKKITPLRKTTINTYDDFLCKLQKIITKKIKKRIIK